MTSNCCGVGRSRLFSSILPYILHCQTGDVTEELQWNPKLTDGLLSTGLSGLFPELPPDLPADGFSPGVFWSHKKSSQHIIRHQVYMPLPCPAPEGQRAPTAVLVTSKMFKKKRWVRALVVMVHGGWEKRSQNSQVEGTVTVVGEALKEFQRANAWKIAISFSVFSFSFISPPRNHRSMLVISYFRASTPPALPLSDKIAKVATIPPSLTKNPETSSRFLHDTALSGSGSEGRCVINTGLCCGHHKWMHCMRNEPA